MTNSWLALVIGNSRLHWAQFSHDCIIHTWNTSHLSSLGEGIGAIAKYVDVTLASPELWIASVVPQQNEIWHDYSPVQFITLDQVPLLGMYPTFGIDRALAVWGAFSRWQSPVLVIDGGTALTFTGVDGARNLVGGAILPGFHLQFEMLHHSTAGLPLVQPSSQSDLPDRWNRDTPAAIAAGITHTLVAGVRSFITDWCQQFPDSKVVLTGGDGERLCHYLTQSQPALPIEITVDPHLIFAGIQAIRR